MSHCKVQGAWYKHVHGLIALVWYINSAITSCILLVSTLYICCVCIEYYIWEYKGKGSVGKTLKHIATNDHPWPCMSRPHSSYYILELKWLQCSLSSNWSCMYICIPWMILAEYWSCKVHVLSSLIFSTIRRKRLKHCKK